jgi:hypothetical protein
MNLAENSSSWPPYRASGFARTRDYVAAGAAKDPTVALTIDTEVHPPKILLIRGRPELDVVDGIPAEYLQMNGSYVMTPEQRIAWEAEVRSLYDGMVRIVVTPTWAKLITPPCPSRLGREAAPCAQLWRRGVRAVFDVRQEMSRWDVENPRAASSPQ